LIDQWSAMALLWRKGKMLIHHFIDRWMKMPFQAKSLLVWCMDGMEILNYHPLPLSRHCVT
jgi:hypothetical protein